MSRALYRSAAMRYRIGKGNSIEETCGFPEMMRLIERDSKAHEGSYP